MSSDTSEINLAIQTIGSVPALARALSVSAQSIYFWRKGQRSIPIEKCALIERVTDGAVTRQMLRPEDWREIWPELAERLEGVSPSIAAGSTSTVVRA